MSHLLRRQREVTTFLGLGERSGLKSHQSMEHSRPAHLPRPHDKQHLSAALFLKNPARLSLEDTQDQASPERTKGRSTH